MRSFFKFFIDRPLVANTVTIMTLLLGAITLPNINRNTFPPVDFGELTITTRFLGASAEDVERTVTNKIEKELKGIDGIKRMQSTSVENVSLIHIAIDIDTADTDEVKDKIQKALDRVTDLPPEVTDRPVIFELESDTFPVMEVGLGGDIPYRELLAIAKRFEKKLEDLRGVGKLVKYGYFAREIQVEADPDKLQKFQISLNDIIRAIRDKNVRASMGDFDTDGGPSKLFTNAEFRTPLDVKEVIVRSNFNDQIIRIKDLAIVVDGFEDPTVKSRVNGLQAISFDVLKSSGADVIKTVKRIEALIEQESKLLPEGVYFVKAHDFSYYLKNRLKVLISNGIIGLFLVAMVLWFFLNIKTAFWVALGIPVTLFGTLFLLPIFDMNINIITLLAMIIIVGIIVDDAIIIAESIAQHRERGESPKEAALNGLMAVYKPVITTVLTTFLAFAPMFVMTGIMGRFIFVIPLVITCALTISVMEGFIALPAHLLPGMKTLTERSPFAQRKFEFIRAVRKRYRAVLRQAIRIRYGVALFFVFLFAGTIFFAATWLNFVLFPESSAQNIIVQIECPVDSMLDDTEKKVAKVEKEILALMPHEIQAFTTRVGMYGDFFHVGEKENFAMTLIDLTPMSQRKRTAREIANELRERTKDFQGYTKILFVVDSGGPPLGRPITLRIVGDDDKQREALASRIVQFLNSIEGTSDIERDDKPENEQFQLIPNIQKLSRLGMSVSDIVRTVRTAYTGTIASSVRYSEDDVDFRVMLNRKMRNRLSRLNNLLIPNQMGRLIRLKDVATIRRVPGSPNYYHFGDTRSITILGDIDKSKISVIGVTKKVQKEFNMPKDWPTLELVIGGEAEETQESVQGLIRSFGVSIVAIFFLLMLLFNSFVQPFLAILAIPFGILGVIWAFALHGQDLGFLSMIGTVGLSGVVVNDSLVMINHFNDLRRKAPGRNVHAIVIRACSNRFRPIVLTSLTTISGLLPLAYGWGGSDPFIAPMALALGYGILFSTPLTLLVLPCFLLIAEDFKKRLTKPTGHPPDNAAP